MCQGSPDVMLEYYYNYKDDGTQEVGQYPVEYHQLQFLGNKIKNKDHSETVEHLQGPGPFDKKDDAVYDEGDHQNIQGVPPP
jgi:hypothetical protein